jgi:hypothetical protein
MENRQGRIMRRKREQQPTVITGRAQKQMGAYYTEADITAYISKNTIIPFLFDVVSQKYPAAGLMKSLLRANPERYIYEAARKGCELPLPPWIEAGVNDVTRRAAWNQPAPAAYALPLETWREVVARRQRCAEIRAGIQRGEISSLDDMITWNLDICRLALDTIRHCEEGGLLLAFYESIERVTILDPTCGEGAFLLAALNVLEPLYEACLERMQRMSEEYARLKVPFPDAQPAFIERFRAVLQEAERYPHRRYFIDKAIIARNLYGVDMMEEATASCRMHLLFRLLSTIEDATEEKSLPALESNIRTGNALVGFAWYAEFQEIMRGGGFDVIIGNPPYLSYNKVKDAYEVQPRQTQQCGNLYAYTLERALELLRPGGRCGMIVPVSAISGARYRSLSRLLLERRLWVSSYSNRPGKLFAEVEQRLAILLISNADQPALFSSPYRHWYEPERAHLFDTLSYVASSPWPRTGMPLKSGTAQAEAIFSRMSRQQGFPLLECAWGKAAVWVHNGPTYWVRALPFEPNVGQEGAHSNHYYRIPVSSQDDALLLTAILSSSTFYFFYKLVSNCRDLGRKELRLFPLGRLQPAVAEQLIRLGGQLARRLKETSVQCSRRYPSGVITYQVYYPASAKAILDEIDRTLAGHYGFTEDELDFLSNYDIKYRLGKESYL